MKIKNPPCMISLAELLISSTLSSIECCSVCMCVGYSSSPPSGLFMSRLSREEYSVSLVWFPQVSFIS